MNSNYFLIDSTQNSPSRSLLPGKIFIHFPMHRTHMFYCANSMFGKRVNTVHPLSCRFRGIGIMILMMVLTVDCSVIVYLVGWFLAFTMNFQFLHENILDISLNAVSFCFRRLFIRPFVMFFFLLLPYRCIVGIFVMFIKSQDILKIS